MGIILTKELILVDKAACQRVGELKMRSAPQLNSETRLYDMLRLFETGRCHMAVLAHNPGTPLPHGARAPAPIGCMRVPCAIMTSMFACSPNI